VGQGCLGSHQGLSKLRIRHAGDQDLSSVPRSHPQGTALVAVTDNLCNLTVYRYDGSRLEELWRKLHDLELKHSSPLITDFGNLIVGDEEGKVTAFDVLTGKETWTYDAGEAALSIPAAFGMTTYILSKHHIHLVNTVNGHQIDHHALQASSPNGEVHTLSSPAVSNKWFTSLRIGD
jgi:outer membrane protein assembly factor BamB